jgi:hypothetical protein
MFDRASTKKKYKEIEVETPQIAVSNRPLENF